MALAVLVAASGCYWHRYEALVETHLEVMTGLAQKLQDLLGSEDSPRHIAMNEYAYPLSRARDFARIVRSRRGERESFRRFERFLEAYEALIREGDRLRQAEAPTEDRGRQLGEALASLDREADLVLEALREEG